MASLNKVLLIGNLTRDPEVRYTPSGAAVCEFGMAMNRTYTSNNEKKEEVCYVDINVWGRQAEACNKYLQKGSSLFVEGRLHLDQWNDKETGKSRSRLRVVAERTQFLGSSRKGEYGEENTNYNDVQHDSGMQMPPPPQGGMNNQPAGTGMGGAPPPQQQPPVTNPSAPGGLPSQAPVGGTAVPPPASPQHGGAFDTGIASEDDIPF